MKREESKADRARRAELKRQRQEHHANIAESRAEEQLARDVAGMFVAAEALTIEPPSVAPVLPEEPSTSRAEGEQRAIEEPNLLRVEEERTTEEPRLGDEFEADLKAALAESATAEEIHEAVVPTVNAEIEEAPSSPMLADSEIAAEGEYPPSPIPVDTELMEELPPYSPTPAEQNEKAALVEAATDPLENLSWAEQMDLADKEEEEERQRQLEDLRKAALKTMPRYARGEAAERDPAVAGPSRPMVEPPFLPPTLFQPVAAKVTLVAEAISRPIFIMPGEGEQKQAWYQPGHPLIQSVEERYRQGAIPRFIRQPRTIYHKEIPKAVEVPTPTEKEPVDVPMEVDESAPILLSVLEKPAIVEIPAAEKEKEASVIVEKPAAAAAPEEPKRKEPERKREIASTNRRATEIPPQREVTPLPVLPVDTAPIVATPTRWDDPAPSKYAAMNLAPYSRIQEHQEYAALHPSKGAIKKARKDREDPNPRRHLVKDDYVPRHLSSPPPQNWRQNAVDPAQRVDPYRRTAPSAARPAPAAHAQQQDYSWPAPAADWTIRDTAPSGNWRAPPPPSSSDLRGWLNERGTRAEIRVDNPRRRASEGDQRGEYYGRNPTEGRRTDDSDLRGVCRTVYGGTMYHNTRAIVTDPRVDPPARVCYNCWEPGHTFTKCPRPQTQHYCRNCGRRNVEVQDCPRCSEAHREHLGQQQRQYQEYLMRVGQEEMRRRRAELFASSPWTLEQRDQFDFARPSTSRAPERAVSEPADRQRASRKRTRCDSPHDRRSKRRSREESVASTSSRREEPRILGARHETFRILEETRTMPDHIREGLMLSIVSEFKEKQEERRRYGR